MKFCNIEQIGNPVAIIKNGNGKLKNKIIFVDEKDKAIHPFNELKIEGNETYFQIIPNTKVERQILYINGQSGSGKTYFIKQYLVEYKKLFPKNSIYCFSPFDDDISYDGVKIQNIKIEDELIDDNLTSKDFENCMCIFDDVEAISNRALKKEILRIMDDILTTGRHYRVSACVVFHEACAGNQTKKVLNESSSITFFPVVMGTRALKYLCESYLGLDQAQIKRIRKLKTRACTIIKAYPKICVSNKEIFCLCDDSDSDESESSDSEQEIIVKKKKKKKSGKYLI